MIEATNSIRFSVLIAGYFKDNPEHLREALKSLELQTLPASEIVFVEDGPLSDALYEVLDKYTSKLPLKVVKIDSNYGLGNALNVGLKECSFDIVLRMDTDDICHEQRFERQVKFLLGHDDISIVGTWAKDIDNEGNIVGERTYPTSHDDLYSIIWSCPFAHPSIAFRRSDILKIGSYRTDIKRRQDYELWMRAAINGLRFANIPEFLLQYRFTEEYYRKNNISVAWSQSKMGYSGLRKLKVKSLYPYVAIFSPVIRSILPGFMEKSVHRLLRQVDPRRQKRVNYDEI